MHVDPNSPVGQAIQAALAAGTAVETGVVRAAAIEPPKQEAARKRKKPALAVPSYQSDHDSVEFVIPLHVYAGDNLSGRMSKSRIGRAGHERRVTAKVLARGLLKLAYYAGALCCGRRVRVTLTRLGGRKMDAANVVAAMKYVQDTVALFLGQDDANPLLDWHYQQAPGGPSGVRVRLERG